MIYKIDRKKKHNAKIIVDRLVIKEEIKSRLTESIEIALKHANNTKVMINIKEKCRGGQLCSTGK